MMTEFNERRNGETIRRNDEKAAKAKKTKQLQVMRNERKKYRECEEQFAALMQSFDAIDYKLDHDEVPEEERNQLLQQRRELTVQIDAARDERDKWNRRYMESQESLAGLQLESEVPADMRLYDSGALGGKDAQSLDATALNAQEVALNVTSGEARKVMDLSINSSEKEGKKALKGGAYHGRKLRSDEVGEAERLIRLSARMSEDAVREQLLRGSGEEGEEKLYEGKAFYGGMMLDGFSGKVGSEFQIPRSIFASKGSAAAMKSFDEVGTRGTVGGKKPDKNAGIASISLKGKGAFAASRMSAGTGAEKIMIPGGTTFRVTKAKEKVVSDFGSYTSIEGMSSRKLQEEHNGGSVFYAVELEEKAGPSAAGTPEAERRRKKMSDLRQFLAQKREQLRRARMNQGQQPAPQAPAEA